MCLPVRYPCSHLGAGGNEEGELGGVQLVSMRERRGEGQGDGIVMAGTQPSRLGVHGQHLLKLQKGVIETCGQ